MELSCKAKVEKFVLPFVTTYLGESGFSFLVMILMKYWNRLNAESESKLSKITSRFYSIRNKKQAYLSH